VECPQGVVVVVGVVPDCEGGGGGGGVRQSEGLFLAGEVLALERPFERRRDSAIAVGDARLQAPEADTDGVFAVGGESRERENREGLGLAAPDTPVPPETSASLSVCRLIFPV
jgi:hypothetical protein